MKVVENKFETIKQSNYLHNEATRKGDFMKSILNQIEDSLEEEIIEEECIQDEEEIVLDELKDEIYLPSAIDIQDVSGKYQQIMFFYESGIQQVIAKLQILNNEFKFCNDRNPIDNITSRVKSLESITKKMRKKGLPLTMNYMVKELHDIAGVRVVCPFISDVYYVANILVNHHDVEVVEIKDYIKNPKPNGYRSLHLIIMVDVYFSDHKSQVPVEVQIRTIAMNFWASTEHQLRYKKDREFSPEMQKELLECSRLMELADQKMQELAEQFSNMENKSKNF